MMQTNRQVDRQIFTTLHTISKQYISNYYNQYTLHLHNTEIITFRMEEFGKKQCYFFIGPVRRTGLFRKKYIIDIKSENSSLNWRERKTNNYQNHQRWIIYLGASPTRKYQFQQLFILHGVKFHQIFFRKIHTFCLFSINVFN